MNGRQYQGVEIVAVGIQIRFGRVEGGIVDEALQIVIGHYDVLELVQIFLALRVVIGVEPFEDRLIPFEDDLTEQPGPWLSLSQVMEKTDQLVEPPFPCFTCRIRAERHKGVTRC
mgnify:CR=1 FL=1